MSLISLKAELRAVRTAINELCTAIDKHSAVMHAAEEDNSVKPSRAEPTKAVISFDEPTKTDSKAEHNRQYAVQNSIRWAAWFAFLAAFLYAGIAAFQWCEMRRATAAATQATRIASQQLEFSERPWVYGAVSLSGPLTFDQGGAEIPLHISLRNSGNSPALQTSIGILVAIDYKDSRVDAFREESCKTATFLSPSLGIALFPKTGAEAGRTVPITYGDIRNGISEWDKIYPKSPLTEIIAPELFVCISYHAGFTKKLYSTSYTMDLNRLDAQGRPVSSFTVGQNIDQKQLSLTFDAITPITAN